MAKNSFSIVRVVIVVAIVVAGAYVFLLPGGSSKEASKKTQCISNLKQLGTAMLIYADNHDGRVPRDAWFNPLMPIAKNPNLFTCADVASSGRKWGYAMSTDIAGAKLDSIQDRSSKPMLFETDALGQDVIANIAARSLGRHGSNGKPGGVVCRADSSTKFYAGDVKVPE